MTYHGAVLPYALVLPDGPQSPSERLRPNRGGRAGFPRTDRTRADRDGALYGIVGAVLISVLTLLFQLSRRPLELVEAVPSPGAAQISIPDAMLLVRPRSDILFANVQHFRRDLYAALAARDPKPSIVLIDASRRYLFEFTAHQIVRDMVADLRAQGLEIWVVLPRGEAAEAISRFRDVFGPAEVQPFPTISDRN